jgi:glucose-6-phosphate 1-dehydrogenase
MIKITLPKKKGMKEKVYEIWDELKLTGHMLIEQKDKSYVVTLEPEKEISLELLKKKLPKESMVEKVTSTYTSKADEDMFTESNPEEMDA